MEKYFRERFQAQRRIAKNLSSSLEVNEILESLREETRNLIASALEVCILLLDPDAHKYTRPLQCALHNRPVNGLSCKRDRVVASVKVNMGINSGVALLGMSHFKGSLGTRMTYTASGPVTNLAARLADYAKGGDILIGNETRKLIEGLWPVYDHGMATIKGIEKPIMIYSLLNLSSSQYMY